MSREIKFRGFSKRDKNWHWGYFRVAPDDTHFIQERVAITHFADYEVVPESVGMSAGQPDKNGVEIFGSIPINGKMSRGGDIVNDQDGKVIFLGSKFLIHYEKDEWEDIYGAMDEITGKQYEEGK